MESKEHVLLAVFIATRSQQWFVTSVDLRGEISPLIRSEPGDLDEYANLSFDEQVTFLRHRLSGVLQRGNDRLWGRGQKAQQIAFIADGNFVDATEGLTERVAEHFVEWIAKPPVIYLINRGGFTSADTQLEVIAGDMEQGLRQYLEAGLGSIPGLMEQSELWEVAPRKRGT